jgi:hypothetical protein
MLVGSLGEELGSRILKKKRPFLRGDEEKSHEKCATYFYSADVSLANQQLRPFSKRVIFRSDQYKNPLT